MFGVPSPNPQPLAQVVGDNCRRLRGRLGITQDDLARHARDVGLRWRASSVGDFEAGRSAPTLATVIAVAVALQGALDDSAKRSGEQPAWEVTLADLVTTGTAVAVTDTLIVPGDALAWCFGDTTQPADDDDDPHSLAHAAAWVMWRRNTLDGLDAVMARSGVAETRMAKQLGVTATQLAMASLQLWGGTFTEERDRRAGPDANAQKRGQVARALRDDITAAIAAEEGNNGND